MSDYIRIEQSNGILKLSLDRIDKKNALDTGMYQALANAINGANTDSDCRVIYISGVGDTFCSGNDLNDFLQNPPSGPEAPAFQFLDAIINAEKPIVAAVNGLAVGIGTTMLLHFDFVYTDETAQFNVPFVKLGVCAEAGSSLLFPLLCGSKKAADILLAGEPFNAEDAKSMGLVNDIVASNELHSRALSQAAMLAKLPVQALLSTKRLMKQSIKPQLETVMKEELDQFMCLLQEDETKQILSSFFKN